MSGPGIALGRVITIQYINHRKQHQARRIVPEYLWWGSTQWHPAEGWLLHAWDIDKQAYRDFAWTGINEGAALHVLNDLGNVPMFDEKPDDPSLVERVMHKRMTHDQRALAAFSFYVWLDAQGVTMLEAKRRFVESGLLDERVRT